MDRQDEADLAGRVAGIRSGSADIRQSIFDEKLRKSGGSCCQDNQLEHRQRLLASGRRKRGVDCCEILCLQSQRRGGCIRLDVFDG